MGSSGFRAVIRVQLNGIHLEMELDTGAKASVIYAGVFKALFKGQDLRPTPTLVWGKPLKMKGEFDVRIEYQGQQAKLPLCVTERNFPSLFELSWARHIRPDYNNIIPVNVPVLLTESANSDSYVGRLSTRFPQFFREQRGAISGFEVNLRLRPNAQPVFQEPRNIAVPLREATKQLLERMEQEGSIERCSPGPWGSPVVVVPKKNEEVRICGDFSHTINSVLDVAGRALPPIYDLTLVVGNCFRLLDLAQAYLQLRVGAASQDLLKFNTCFGTYRCLRMPFGISSAPNDFQEIICSILAGVSNIFIYLDDILLWGKSEEE
jgi:hypothetical protein